MKTEKLDYKNVEKVVFKYLDEMLKNEGVEKLEYKKRAEAVESKDTDKIKDELFKRCIRLYTPVHLKQIDMNNIFDIKDVEEENIMIDKKKLKEFIVEAIDYYSFYYGSQQLKLCNKFFPKKENKSLITAIGVLQRFFLIDEAKKEELLDEIKTINDLEDIEEDVVHNEKIKKLATMLSTEVFKILRCNNLISKKENHYFITKNLFHDEIRFQIKDKPALKTLAPLLLSYIRTSSKLQAEDFFEIIDKLIEFLLQSSPKHNGYAILEGMIYRSILSKDMIDINIKGESKALEIYPIRIEIFNDKKTKILHYETDNDSTQKTISLSSIISIKTSNNPQFTPSNNMMISSYMIEKEEEQKDKPSKKEKVLLAVNMILYEYFQSLTIFEEMEFITDKLEILNRLDLPMGRQVDKVFIDDLSAPSADYFLIEAVDEHNFIVQEVQKNLQYIKVISPQSIKDTIASNLSTFSKNLAL